MFFLFSLGSQRLRKTKSPKYQTQALRPKGAPRGCSPWRQLPHFSSGGGKETERSWWFCWWHVRRVLPGQVRGNGQLWQIGSPHHSCGDQFRQVGKGHQGEGTRCQGLLGPAALYRLQQWSNSCTAREWFRLLEWQRQS